MGSPSPSRRGGHARTGVTRKGSSSKFFSGINAVVTLMDGLDVYYNLYIVEERVRRPGARGSCRCLG